MIVKRWHVVPLVTKNVEFVLLERAKSRKKQRLSRLSWLSRPKLAVARLSGSQPKWWLQRFQLGPARVVAGSSSGFSRE